MHAADERLSTASDFFLPAQVVFTKPFPKIGGNI